MKVLHYLKRAVSLPPHIVFQKAFFLLRSALEEKKKRRKDERCSTYELDRNKKQGRLHTFLREIDLKHLDKLKLEEFNQRSLKHEFNLLGSGWTHVFIGMRAKGLEGHLYTFSKKSEVNESNRLESNRIQALLSSSYRPIDWQIDFKSGYRWSEALWMEDIKYGSDLGADVKVPWELARMHHLVSLALGYALEKEESFLLEFQNQVLDFIASNPPRYGVNWVCAMDVGIRVSNWLLAYDLFSCYGALFDPEFEAVFIRSIYEHGKHIFSHLEWDPLLSSNHYLANIVGLVFIGSYLQGEDARKWLQFGLKELEKEIFSQFHPDGSNFEASSCYHRLSMEMVLFGISLAKCGGAEISRACFNRIEKMAHFVRDITKPDHTIVQFGDNDSGRFMRLVPEKNSLDHRYLIHASQNLGDLTTLLEALLEPPKELSAPSLSSYPDFGLFLRRKGPWFFAFRCGSIGQKGNGGHAHNDQLSFELSIFGISFIIDPGTYVYTPLPEERNRFRSSFMHNTLALEKEQNEINTLFRMTDRAKAKIVSFNEKEISGQHQGFGHPYLRRIEIFEEMISATEWFPGQGKVFPFHLAPGWKTALLGSKVECAFENLTVYLEAEEGTWSAFLGDYSKAYGVKERAEVLLLKSDNNPVRWRLFIAGKDVR